MIHRDLGPLNTANFFCRDCGLAQRPPAGEDCSFCTANKNPDMHMTADQPFPWTAFGVITIFGFLLIAALHFLNPGMR